MGYDIIGDVHGCYDALKALLLKLGYEKTQKGFYHKHRKAIFIGDLVDRGPKIRETLSLVKDMIDSGHAYIVLGNHELNLLAYCTTVADVFFSKGDNVNHQAHPFLREHSSRNSRILEKTLEQFSNHSLDLQNFIDWMVYLPIFLDFPTFRVVHASWHQNMIDRLLMYDQGYADNIVCIEDLLGFCLSPKLLQRCSFSSLWEHTAVDRLLRGTTLPIPNNRKIVGDDGFARKFFRTSFWKSDPKTYGDVVFQPDPLPEDINQIPLTASDKQKLVYYGPQEKPLFIGHYWMSGSPEPVSTNIACIDYSAVKKGKLVAYRFDHESVLKPRKVLLGRC